MSLGNHIIHSYPEAIHADYSLALAVQVAKMTITVDYCLHDGQKYISILRTTLMRVTLVLLYKALLLLTLTWLG